MFYDVLFLVLMVLLGKKNVFLRENFSLVC